MAQDPRIYNEEDDQYDYKYSESCHQSNRIEEEEEEDEFPKQLLNDTTNDMDDPSISDIDSNKTPKKRRDRTKSKSSSNVLSQLNTNKAVIKPNTSKTPIPMIKKPKQKKEPYIRQRRHSESSSESHSNEYRKTHRITHKTSKSSNNKIPILIPLNVNGKNKKSSKTSSSNPESPRRGKSFTRSIFSKYKSVKLQNKQNKKKQNDEEKTSAPLGISGPLNVQHVIHVEWDDQRKAYKGIPDVWHSKIPQSVTVPTQELPVQFRENRSISLTQSVLHRAKSMSAANIINHQPLPSLVSIKKINGNTACNLSPKALNNKNMNVPIDYIPGDDILAMPMPGPRVFINSLNKKNRHIEINNDISLQIPDFHGLLSNQIMSIKQYLNRIGIDDLDKKMSISMIRREFFVKMGFSKRDPLINIPRHIQQQLLTYLDIKSYLRCCITCSDLASFLDDPIIWKIQVLYKSKVQGTLHKTTFRLRHRVWKATYMNMVKIDKKPSYYDHVWNIVVAGDTKSGQNRLVVSLGRHWRCKLTGLEPVISAVNGTYRFGVDFVIRRVIIRDMIIKLQVWDGGNVMADTSLLKSVNIFLILFDLTKKDSFDRTLNVARSMISLLPNDLSMFMMVGNTTNNPNNRVISYEAAKRFANERGLMYIEANTDNTENNESINNAFVDLAEECILFENEKAALKSADQQKETTNCCIQ